MSSYIKSYIAEEKDHSASVEFYVGERSEKSFRMVCKINLASEALMAIGEGVKYWQVAECFEQARSLCSAYAYALYFCKLKRFEEQSEGKK